MPEIVIQQLQEIAEAKRVPLAEVVREAILRFIADWQAEHDSKKDIPNG